MTRRITRASALAALLVFLCCSASAQTTRLQEFPFAVGAGGFAVSDTGNGSDVKAFSTGGYQLFGEMVLDSGVLLQMRYQSFMLPGTPPTAPAFTAPAPRGAPRVSVEAGQISFGYLFRENWWDAGFVGGVGIYRLKPDPPGVDQVSTDSEETVVGWHGGAVVIFLLAPRLDLRLEATGYLLQSNASHKPIELGAMLAYHF